ncbi:MAG: tetratricopeptide repeat protein [Cyanobacteria bacterium P01_D01_bin.6]
MPVAAREPLRLNALEYPPLRAEPAILPQEKFQALLQTEVANDLKQANTSQQILLQVEGDLADGDASFDNGSLYDVHTFQGQAGQIVQITLDSQDFDTYLLLNAPLGEQIAANDDGGSGTNAEIVVQLPEDGVYRVLANAYDQTGRGNYRLVVSVASDAALQRASQDAEADRLLQQGNEQYGASQFSDALDSWQAALELYRQLGSRKGEANALGNLGAAYARLGDYRRAIDFHEQSLAIAHEIGNRQVEANSLNNLGAAYARLGDYRRAIDFHEQSLAIAHEIGDRQGEANSLNNLGIAYNDLGNYRRAIDLYEQSLAIAREIGYRSSEANSLNNLGLAYDSLGNYRRAIDFHEQSLAIAREIGDRRGEAISLGNLGIAYDRLGDYRRAIDFHEQSLAIKRDIGDRQGEANSLGNLGLAYDALGDYRRAIDLHEQYLAIAREIGDRQGEANSLGNLGSAYRNLGDYRRAIDYHEQSLAIKRDIGDRQGEANSLTNLAYALEAEAQPELAIIFFKQAVNTYETIRDSNRGLEADLQSSYTATVEHTYRHLADLLLQQDRILEAQRVLDLLKVQELDDYLRGVRRNADTEAGVTFRPAEQELLQRYTANQDQLIALGQERAELAKIPRDQRTAAQAERIVELRRLEQTIRQQFRGFFEQSEIVELVNRLRRTVGAANIELAELNALRDNLQNLDQDAVVLYPLILEDRLELVLVTPDTAPIRRTVTVRREDLNRTIGELRHALESPSRDAVTPAQQLYDWLIRPIEADLAQAEAKTIIYAPDLQLRYVPLAALHDGDQWLIETYRVNNITAASLDDLDNAPSPGGLNILAAAFTEGRHDVPVGEQTLRFSGLPFAGVEVENLAALVPGTEQRLNENFSADIVYEMDDYRIVHLATHAIFNPGPPENSFILFGNGDRATLADVKNWSFPNVELIVLSACETAVGDVPLGNGEEILGFGYLMQLAGADAAIASLWAVDDGGTQVLMNGFYDVLNQGGLAKAEALRQAQISLIRAGEEGRATGSGDDDNRGGFELVATSSGSNLDPSDLSHPHYWAPFILIGNGL